MKESQNREFSSKYSDLIAEFRDTVHRRRATAPTRTNNSSEPGARTPDWSRILWRGFNRCHGPIANNVLLWTQNSGGTTLIYMMDVRSKAIQPRFCTSFEFMHGAACQGRETMWTLLSLFVRIPHFPPPPSPPPLPPPPPHPPSRLKPVVGRLPSRIYDQHLRTYENECN